MVRRSAIPVMVSATPALGLLLENQASRGLPYINTCLYGIIRLVVQMFDEFVFGFQQCVRTVYSASFNSCRVFFWIYQPHNIRFRISFRSNVRDSPHRSETGTI